MKRTIIFLLLIFFSINFNAYARDCKFNLQTMDKAKITSDLIFNLTTTIPCKSFEIEIVYLKTDNICHFFERKTDQTEDFTSSTIDNCFNKDTMFLGQRFQKVFDWLNHRMDRSKIIQKIGDTSNQDTTSLCVYSDKSDNFRIERATIPYENLRLDLSLTDATTNEFKNWTDYALELCTKIGEENDYAHYYIRRIAHGKKLDSVIKEVARQRNLRISHLILLGNKTLESLIIDKQISYHFSEGAVIEMMANRDENGSFYEKLNKLNSLLGYHAGYVIINTWYPELFQIGGRQATPIETWSPSFLGVTTTDATAGKRSYFELVKDSGSNYFISSLESKNELSNLLMQKPEVFP